jgi:hypothetical protein
MIRSRNNSERSVRDKAVMLMTFWLVAFILFPNVVAAEDRTIQHLYYLCKKPIGSIENAACAGYISGIADVMITLATEPRTNKLIYFFSMCS